VLDAVSSGFDTIILVHLIFSLGASFLQNVRILFPSCLMDPSSTLVSCHTLPTSPLDLGTGFRRILPSSTMS
jgi:hypothetical protein